MTRRTKNKIYGSLSFIGGMLVAWGLWSYVAGDVTHFASSPEARFLSMILALMFGTVGLGAYVNRRY